MKARDYISKITAIREYIEKHRGVLQEMDKVPLCFSDEKIAKYRRKELDFKQAQEDINQDCEVLKICVAGEFSSGKSTFINSLLGEELLGMDICPSTAKVTALSYGPDVRFFKFHKRGRNKTEITKEEFNKYSQKNEDHVPDNDVSYFELTYPCEFLKQIILYDTPGFSTAMDSEVDDKMTDAQITKSDLVIWLSVCSNGSLKSSEVKILKDINVPFHCMINKIDELPDSDRTRAIEEISKHVKDISQKAKVFPYASVPILESSNHHKQVQKSLQVVFEEIFRKIERRDGNPVQLKINSNEVSLNGNIQQLPILSESCDSEFMQYKESFLKNLKDQILDKSESRKLSQRRFNKEVKSFYAQLSDILQKANENAEKRIAEFEKQIQIEIKQQDDTLKHNHKQADTHYRNTKLVMMDDINFKFFKRKTMHRATCAYKEHDQMKKQAREMLSEPVVQFSKVLVSEMKKLYLGNDNDELFPSSDATKWSNALRRSFLKIVNPTMSSIPIKLQMKNLTEEQQVKFEKQLLDNMIPDELFYNLLKLHCTNISNQKFHSDIAVKESWVKTLTEFKKSTAIFICELESKSSMNQGAAASSNNVGKDSKSGKTTEKRQNC